MACQFGKFQVFGWRMNRSAKGLAIDCNYYFGLAIRHFSAIYGLILCNYRLCAPDTTSYS